MPITDKGMWRCWCGGPHFLVLSLYGNDDDAAEWELDVAGDLDTPRWRDRVRMAWTLLRRGGVHTHVGLLLDEATTREVVTALTELLPSSSSSSA